LRKELQRLEGRAQVGVGQGGQRGGAFATLYLIGGGGPSWPGLARPSTTVNARAFAFVDARPKAGHDAAAMRANQFRLYVPKPVFDGH
jgi:hypothetical protein